MIDLSALRAVLGMPDATDAAVIARAVLRLRLTVTPAELPPVPVSLVDLAARDVG